MERAMNEVQQLLREAWQKAYENWVVLNNVDFNLTQNMVGEYSLINIDIDARMKEQSK
jgi:hypothetical protein|tara:strand:- start:41859 stop:42032 length:174 start_codon:yes stop_codon:yes gene_type:complete